VTSRRQRIGDNARHRPRPDRIHIMPALSSLALQPAYFCALLLASNIVAHAWFRRGWRRYALLAGEVRGA